MRRVATGDARESWIARISRDTDTCGVMRPAPDAISGRPTDVYGGYPRMAGPAEGALEGPRVAHREGGSATRSGGKDAAGKLKSALSTSSGASNVEQWAVNKAVHYSEWANFGKKDFEPVVGSFKDLLECFSCGKCESWLFVTPRSNPDSLRCACNVVNLNLRPKPK